MTSAPVNADAPEVDDHVTGPLGVKGVGEIGQVGAGAIANAVYNATGYRVRELPIAVEHPRAHLAASPVTGAVAAQPGL
jgi:xanthine dehydrogenase YagR molybdenum-binding subunit